MLEVTKNELLNNFIDLSTPTPFKTNNIKLNSKWKNLRDKNMLQKIRLQNFNKDINNDNTFLKKNENIFKNYDLSSGGKNIFLKSEKKKGVNPLLQMTKNIVAQKFTNILKRKVLDHTLNENQLKYLNDSAYRRHNQHIRRRQVLKSKIGGDKSGLRRESVSFTEKEIVIKNY